MISKQRWETIIKRLEYRIDFDRWEDEGFSHSYISYKKTNSESNLLMELLIDPKNVKGILMANSKFLGFDDISYYLIKKADEGTLGFDIIRFFDELYKVKHKIWYKFRIPDDNVRAYNIIAKHFILLEERYNLRLIKLKNKDGYYNFIFVKKLGGKNG